MEKNFPTKVRVFVGNLHYVTILLNITAKKTCLNTKLAEVLAKEL